MAKTPIGQPIPVGDPSSLIQNPSPEVEMSPEPVIEALRSDIIPTEGFAAPTENALSTLPRNPPGEAGWLDMMQVGWRLAFMPALAWSTFLAASCRAWENSLQPQWPSR
jgi:hypothetical protein